MAISGIPSSLEQFKAYTEGIETPIENSTQISNASVDQRDAFGIQGWKANLFDEQIPIKGVNVKRDLGITGQALINGVHDALHTSSSPVFSYETELQSNGRMKRTIDISNLPSTMDRSLVEEKINQASQSHIEKYGNVRGWDMAILPREENSEKVQLELTSVPVHSELHQSFTSSLRSAQMQRIPSSGRISLEKIHSQNSIALPEKLDLTAGKISGKAVGMHGWGKERPIDPQKANIRFHSGTGSSKIAAFQISILGPVNQKGHEGREGYSVFGNFDGFAQEELPPLKQLEEGLSLKAKGIEGATLRYQKGKLILEKETKLYGGSNRVVEKRFERLEIEISPDMQKFGELSYTETTQKKNVLLPGYKEPKILTDVKCNQFEPDE